MCKIKFIYFLLIVFGCIVVDDCFNLDTINYVKYSGTRGTMFGFSVATHKDKGQPWILIGAPADDSRQRGVYQGGAVYRCDVRRDDHCTPLPFDSNGNLNDSSGRQIDQKSHQWFGATVHSGGADKPIVACAPRYVWFSTSLQRRDPVGTCFLSKSDFTDFHEYSPCRTKNWGYHRQGACQAGFSAAVSKDGERLFISAPGSWYWQGQMYSLDPTVHHPYRYRFGEYGATGQAYAQNLQERPSVLSTKEGQSSDDDSYMGYSLAVGDFTGDGMSGAAIGMPRGNTKNKKLVGKVVLYTWNLTNHQNISGEQLGAYFGYSIAAADVDGDKLDDLIIGAPLYTTPNNEGKYEVGRIYVRYQRNKEFNGRFQKLHTRDGVNSRGRFGLAVASLGDLDLDGYGDIGVGAPYDGPGERGVVYIFYGSSEGLREKPSQVIRAEQVNQMSLYTFGFSISGNNIDLDNNQYPDIIVGSYLSDTAVVFKTRAVIKLTSSILFSTSNKVISLDEKLCSLRNRERVTCTDIKSCFHYNGTGVNRNIDLNIQYILDAKNMKDPRMFFLNQERISTMNQTRRLESHVLNCVSTKVYIKDNIRDKLTPLEVEMRYSLKDENLNAYRERSTQYVLPPILDQNVPSVYKDKITIRKNCGSDDICIPNLRLITQPNVEKYLLGSNKRLSVDVMVQNHGEDSFESVFYMKLPKGVNYFKFERIDDSSIPVQCSAPSAATNNTLKCDIGNPLPAERMVHFKVLLDPYHEEGMAPSYDFEMGVNSTNPELGETTGDNTRFLSINIWVETNISLTGWAQSAEIFYNTTTYDFENYTSESEIGPQVVHFYSLKNNGPSLINQATAMFMWPDKTLAGDDLMYLLEQPELSGSIKCDFAYPNPLKVTLDRKKSYLETIGITPNEDDVNYGALSSTGSVSYGSSSHIDTHLSGHRKTEEDRKIEESGDGSYVHINRGKELSKAEMEGARGGTRTYVSQSSWNTSSQNGSPVVTQSWNRTTVTGSDGVTRETSYHSTGGGTGLEGSQGSKAKIFYTSSRGNAEQQSGSQQGGNQFSISGQDSGDQFSTSSRFGQTQAGSEGTSHSTSSHGTSSHGTSSHGTSSQGSTYRETSHRGSHETSHGTFSQGAHGSSQGAHGSSQGAHGSSQGAHGSSQGFSQGAHGSSYGSSSHGSSSHSSHGIVVSTQRTVSSTSRTYDTSGEETLHHGGGSRGPFDWNGAGGDRQGSRQYEREEHSRTVYQGSNEIGREEARRHGVSGYGTSGHEVSGHGTSGHGVSGHGASGHGASGHGASGHGVSSHGVSSHEVFTHGVSTHGASGQGVSGHGTSSHGISSHGTSSHGTSSHGISGQGASGHGGGAQGSFHQSGTRHNGTHQITWTAEGSRDYDTSGGEAGIKFYNTFVTEESVNQGINDYTQEVLTHGRQHGHRQENHHSQGHRQEDRHSQGHRQETHNQGRQYGASQETHHNQGRQYGASQETHHNQGRQYGSQESHHSGSGRDRSTYGKYNQSSYDASLGLGGAAIGGGFRTTTLDLGVGTNTNVDENISGNDDEYDYSSEVHYDPDLGSYEDRSNGQGRSGVSYGSSRTASGERHYGNQHGSQGRGQSSHHYESHSRTYESHGGTNGGGRSYESHSSRQYTGDNVPTEYPLRHRNKRSTDEDLLVKCKATQCRALRCVTGPIKKDEEAWVALRFRVNAQTLKKIVSKDSMDLSSMMTARIDKLPYIGTPKDEERTIHSHEVFTKLTPTDTEAKVDVIPLWIVVLSACAGAIILLLLAFLLYKCGFFKRNRPSDAPERQPLNRNGYHGDEQL